MSHWLRLKGVRDVASGLAVLAVLIWGNAHGVGLLLLADAAIPAGDMLTILGAKGSVAHALGIHGSTMLAMIVVASLIPVNGA